uniref:Uncharacterized protein n=1 Tax=Hyaloperonospora arabidopsidis (strain Emoy2) TaxID=559515 RepID=M4BZU8_HYAAE
MKPKKWMYTQRKMRMMFGRTLTWQRRLDGDANGDEVTNSINNNVQDDADKKGNQDKKNVNDDHDHKYIEYDDVQDDAGQMDHQNENKNNDDDHEYTTMIITILTHSLFRCICYCLCLMLVAAAAVATTTKDVSPSHGVGSIVNWASYVDLSVDSL